MENTVLSQMYQAGDWKAEKHVPVIESPEKTAKGETFEARVTVGKDIPHPNTSAHHIAWIDVFFLPEGEKFPYHVARAEFQSHGASVRGPDTGGVYTEPDIRVRMKSDRSGTIAVSAYCNIHGLWQGAKELRVE